MTHSSSWSLRSFSALIPLLLAAGCYGADVERGEGAAEPQPTSQGPSGSAGAGEEESESGGEPVAPEGQGGAPSPVPASGGIPIDALPELYAEAACEANAHCWAAHYEVYGGWDCVGVTRTYLEDRLSRWKQAIEEGKAVYDASQVEACIEEMRSQSCDDFLTRNSDVCLAALGGTVPLGEDCNDDIECEGDAFCDFGPKCPGKCVARQARGNHCGDDSSRCADGLVCSDDTYRCVPAGRLGDPCDAGKAPCMPGLFCAGADEDAALPGACKTYADVFSRKLGEACNLSSDELCVAGLHCAQFRDADGILSATCEAPATSGAACSAGDGVGCPRGEYCFREDDASLVGQCTPRPAAGEACAALTAEGDPLICASDLACIDGVCLAPARLGEACAWNAACLSGSCYHSVCISDAGCDWDGER